jgi:hypothetical protein
MEEGLHIERDELERRNQNRKPKMKTTKKKLKDQVDTFYWWMSSVTGGTKSESLKQYPAAIVDLTKQAQSISDLMLNLSKTVLLDDHLIERANYIPIKMKYYQKTYSTI